MSMLERMRIHRDLMKINRKGPYYVADIIDFIIEDRKRVVDPLVKLGDRGGISYIGEMEMAINQTLENAGMEGEG